MQCAPTRRLGGPLCTRDLGPTLEAVPHLCAVRRCGQEMPPRAKVLGNRTIRGQKALGVSRRLEPLHAIFSLACRPTVCLYVTSLVASSYGYDDGKNGPTRCAVIGAARGDR